MAITPAKTVRWWSSSHRYHPGRSIRHPTIWLCLRPHGRSTGTCGCRPSGRPASVVSLGLRRERIGPATENITHGSSPWPATGLIARLSTGENDHHRAEAAFKACALARGRPDPTGEGEIPSTKGYCDAKSHHTQNRSRKSGLGCGRV